MSGPTGSSPLRLSKVKTAVLASRVSDLANRAILLSETQGPRPAAVFKRPAIGSPGTVARAVDKGQGASRKKPAGPSALGRGVGLAVWTQSLWPPFPDYFKVMLCPSARCQVTVDRTVTVSALCSDCGHGKAPDAGPGQAADTEVMCGTCVDRCPQPWARALSRGTQPLL